MNKLAFLVFLIFACTHPVWMSAQTPEDDEVLTPADSLALEQAIVVVDAYNVLMHQYFNGEAEFPDSLRAAFLALFTGSQKILADYAKATWRLEPAEYLFEAAQIFGENRPDIAQTIDYENALIKYFPNDNFHMAAIPIDHEFSFYFDQEAGVVVQEPLLKYLLMEIRISPGGNAHINRIIERAPPIVEPAEPEQPAGLSEPVALKVKPLRKKDLADKPVIDRSGILTAGFLYGTDLGMVSPESLSESFAFSSYDFNKFDFAIGYAIPVFQRGLYIHAGIGFASGNLALTYEKSGFSFEQTDHLNPASDVEFAPAGEVSRYERTAIIHEMSEEISFQDLQVKLGIGKDLLCDDADVLMLTLGVMMAAPLQQRSSVVARTDYYGHFTEINGNAIDLTLGVNEDIPVYGFEERSLERSFDIDTDMVFSGYFNLVFAKALSDHFLIGVQAEAQVPLNDWMSGTGNHVLIFKTYDDVNTSVANMVSQMKRPLYFGGGIVIGFKF